MWDRIRRSAALVPCLLLSVTAGSIGPSGASPVTASQQATRTVRIAEIETLIRESSPRRRIIEQQLSTVAAERDRALQWSNPSLAYDHEEFEPLREWQITLRKRLEKPFSQGTQREGWAGRVRAAEHQTEQANEDLLAELKTGYVRLQLLDEYMERLLGLAEVVELASAAANRQHAEGELAGTAKQLIQLSALTIDSERRRARQDRREYAATWQADLGLPPGMEVDLATVIGYRSVVLSDASDYVSMLSQRPGVRARNSLAIALSQEADAARPSLVPGIDVYGGYKRVASELDGFVAGVALDLPLFDRNAGTARLHEAKQRVVEEELGIYLARSTVEIESLVLLIGDAQQSLTALAGHLDTSPRLTDALLFSYQEGSLSLDAIPGAIQVESAALDNYYDELRTYYRNIFRLETLTGATILRFER